jgi:hypothetical protein
MVRYDNELGKGDHRHFRGNESAYAFKTPDKLIASFQRGEEKGRGSRSFLFGIRRRDS